MAAPLVLQDAKAKVLPREEPLGPLSPCAANGDNSGLVSRAGRSCVLGGRAKSHAVSY
jgi:hypothetical protein